MTDRALGIVYSVSRLNKVQLYQEIKSQNKFCIPIRQQNKFCTPRGQQNKFCTPRGQQNKFGTKIRPQNKFGTKIRPQNKFGTKIRPNNFVTIMIRTSFNRETLYQDKSLRPGFRSKFILQLFLLISKLSNLIDAYS
jgi:hypothetical protein